MCFFRHPPFLEPSKCFPFTTSWGVMDPASLTFTSCLYRAPIPFVSVPHPGSGKLSGLGFLVIDQPFGTLRFQTLSLLLLLRMLVLLLRGFWGSFKFSLLFLYLGLESLDSCVMRRWSFPLILDHHVLVFICC